MRVYMYCILRLSGIDRKKETWLVIRDSESGRYFNIPEEILVDPVTRCKA